MYGIFNVFKPNAETAMPIYLVSTAMINLFPNIISSQPTKTHVLGNVIQGITKQLMTFVFLVIQIVLSALTHQQPVQLANRDGF